MECLERVGCTRARARRKEDKGTLTKKDRFRRAILRPPDRIRDSGNQETVRRWAELEIENRGCMEIRATKRGMSQENLKIIVRGKDCGGFSQLQLQGIVNLTKAAGNRIERTVKTREV